MWVWILILKILSEPGLFPMHVWEQGNALWYMWSWLTAINLAIAYKPDIKEIFCLHLICLKKCVQFSFVKGRCKFWISNHSHFDIFVLYRGSFLCFLWPLCLIYPDSATHPADRWEYGPSGARSTLHLLSRIKFTSFAA